MIWNTLECLNKLENLKITATELRTFLTHTFKQPEYCVVSGNYTVMHISGTAFQTPEFEAKLCKFLAPIKCNVSGVYVTVGQGIFRQL